MGEGGREGGEWERRVTGVRVGRGVHPLHIPFLPHSPVARLCDARRVQTRPQYSEEMGGSEQSGSGRGVDAEMVVVVVVNGGGRTWKIRFGSRIRRRCRVRPPPLPPAGDWPPSTKTAG